jgi:two-component system response regulator CpxR
VTEVGAVAATRQTRVLLIDDDAELCALMTEVLSSHGYDVVTAADGAAGLEIALKARPDLVILDVMMPRLDGFDVLRHLRRQSRAPVIMLTARTTPEDRIQGLNVGADDYLAKPFIVGELLARIRAVLRRSHPVSAQTMAIGSLRIDRTRRRAWAASEEIPLTATEFDLLELLTESSGTIVSRDTIARALYGRDTTAYERAIDVHVSHLRKKLGGVDGVSIRTVRGSGYMFEPHA